MQTLSFDQLPLAVTELFRKLEGIENALLSLTDNRPKVNERLTAKEAADYLNIALPTLYAHTSQKTIKHFKSGKKLSFLKSDLDEFLNQGRKKTANELASEVLLKQRRK
jgi:excisionase family DNA binding protein